MTLLDDAGRLDVGAPVDTRRLDRTVALFSAAVFLGAGLLFLVQPMVVRLVLPSLGGSPQVWNTSMVFFQALLLVGYGYAHVSTRSLGLRCQPLAHLVVLALPLLVLPLGLPEGWRPPATGSPVSWLVPTLAVSVGLPYFAVSTASPLLQRWFSATGHSRAGDPYFLYAASNVGSLTGLLAYPLLVEPHLALQAQSRLWSALYLVFVVLSGFAVRTVRRAGRTVAAGAAPAADASTSPVAWWDRGRWVFFAFVPASLLQGVTTSLTTDVASVPFLWALPLGTYLLTMVVAFGRRQLRVGSVSALVPVAVALVVATQLLGASRLAGLVVLLHVVTLFLVGLLCHGRLALERPAPSKLTEYFLLISLGGVLGGAFNALVAPLVFDGVHEFPLALALALLARPAPAGARRPAWVALAVAGIPAAYLLTDRLRSEASDWAVVITCVAVALVYERTKVTGALALAGLLAMTVLSQGDALRRERTFFGVLRVEDNGQFVGLRHGTTLHGRQSRHPLDRATPSSYYHPTGPVGQLFSAYAFDPRLRRVAVVGLGTGTVSAYSRPDRHFTYYEIDPAVVDIATDPRYFTYLAGDQGTHDIVIGDARRSLAESPDDEFGMIVLDAFSSDSVPVHLLTREAVQLYLDKLTHDGLLVFNVSNRYLDLEPVVAAAAELEGLSGVLLSDAVVDQAAREQGKTPSSWIVLARDRDSLAPFERSLVPAVPLARRDGVAAWTDDYSNLFEILDWRWWR